MEGMTAKTRKAKCDEALALLAVMLTDQKLIGAAGRSRGESPPVGQERLPAILCSRNSTLRASFFRT